MTTNDKSFNYSQNQNFSQQMQPIAIDKYYNKVWPGVRIFEIDIDTKSELSKMVDVAGADKMLRFGNKNIAYLAQRFRQSSYLKYDEFTMRHTELTKAFRAIDEGWFIASFYAYGFANDSKTDFLKFYILKYREVLSHIRTMDLPFRVNNDGTKFYHIKFSSIPPAYFTFKWFIQGNLFKE